VLLVVKDTRTGKLCGLFQVPKSKQPLIQKILNRYFGNKKNSVFELTEGAYEILLDGKLLGQLHPNKADTLVKEIALVLES